MIRLFKHYIPHAVILLGLLDFALLVVASELAWQLRAAQIGMEPDPIEARWIPLVGSATVVWLAMIAVTLRAAQPAVRRGAAAGCDQPWHHCSCDNRLDLAG